ncbi:MAG TPA: hypothetical protein VE783_06325 [Candidatus Limnocylindrales bacterium]|jgi:hypothetical protein|nr:hypothetical protein [Candidatus Limnocylindrales bacterium]
MIQNESHSHGHRTGIPWLDLILAGSAIFISVVSLIVSIHHGRTMEQLVAANEKQVKASTLPILRFVTGNVTDNQKMIHFQLMNGGTGPAIIEWLQLKWDGQPATGPRDLLERCCSAGSPAKALSIWTDVASGTTLPARDSRNVLGVPAKGAGPALYDLLDREARFKVEAEACYCSVLEECWQTDFRNQPREVKACERIPENQRW